MIGFSVEHVQGDSLLCEHHGHGALTMTRSGRLLSEEKQPSSKRLDTHQQQRDVHIAW